MAMLKARPFLGEMLSLLYAHLIGRRAARTALKKLRAVGSARCHGEAVQATTALRAVCELHRVPLAGCSAGRASFIPAQLSDRRSLPAETITEEPMPCQSSPSARSPTIPWESPVPLRKASTA